MSTVTQVNSQVAAPNLEPNMRFAELPTDDVIARTAQALTANGFNVIVVENGEQARQKVHKLLTPGAEVFDATSRTLDAIGLTKELHAGDIPYNAIKPQIYKMNRQTQMREIRKLGAAPDYVIGSVHAVTEQGTLLIASASGSQLGPYASGAGNVIFVVGAQKIVPNLETGLRRIYEYSYPLEDARARQAYGFGSRVAKILMFNSDSPGRVSVILVKENLGF
jgi:L-lactate utilization protein LutC